MYIKLLVALVVLCISVFANCTPQVLEKDPPALFPTATPAPVDQMAYPPETRTGIAVVDAIIDAALINDRDAIQDLVHYTVTGCTHADGLGGPPKCEEGQEEGTLVEVFPIMGPGEGSYTQRDKIDAMFPAEPKSLFAVFRVSDSAYHEDYWPAGRYGIVLRLDGEPVPALTLRVDEGGIVRLDYGYGEPYWLSPTLFEREVDEFILPPAEFRNLPTSNPPAPTAPTPLP